MYVLELAGEDDDFAAYEAECAASAVSVEAPGLATARGVSERVHHLAFTHRVDELVGRGDASLASAKAVLAAASLDRTGSVAVRAENVRGLTAVDTQATERELGQQLVDRGYAVDLDDPDNVLRVLYGEGVCLVGWQAIEIEHDFAARKPGNRPFFQPGSMTPRLARALANVAGARPDASVLDPMCGTGGIALEAGLVGARVLGMDAQPKMVRGTRQNLAAYLDGGWAVLRGDAATLPFRDDAVDAVVFDTPYGRQSKIRGELQALVGDALAEARRVAPRCVVVGDRPWTPVASEAGWRTEAAFDRRVHRSLTRYIAVLRRS